MPISIDGDHRLFDLCGPCAFSGIGRADCVTPDLNECCPLVTRYGAGTSLKLFAAGQDLESKKVAQNGRYDRQLKSYGLWPR
jgi:hypothetical protein